jgi:effector-binding domain-containing protein
MDIQIINIPLNLTIYGFSGTAFNKDYVGKAFQLMDRMWDIVKRENLQNNGKNIWVYEPDHMVFAGVELVDIPDESTNLEQKKIELPGYAYYKHIGPYNLIKEAGAKMIEQLKQQGLETVLPHIEIYGHWIPDESKLETELVMSLK